MYLIHNYGMQIRFYAESQTFFELFSHSEWIRCSGNLPGHVKDFLKKIVLLPLSLVFKVYKTLFRLIGVVWAASLLVMSLGTSETGRTFFFERVFSFAKDLADWILLPLAIASSFLRLGALIFSKVVS
jgi:hypothetical protein